jgi:hypothetical protein
VVIERPGFGVSDFQPNRRILDWPRDVVEVVDALGLDSFAVAGVLGRGPLRRGLRLRSFPIACAPPE